jgi:16S rRNA (uracil1498-N3)-methyltransferase
MKYHQLTRLFISSSLKDASVILTEALDIHYLVKVMRKKEGDHLLIFNSVDGEYLAEIIEITKKKVSFKPIEKIRKPKEEREINLIFAPIKQARMSFLLEKATELGVTHLTPVQTKHSVVDKINLTKWNIYIKEASEQCRRISLPNIMPLQTIDKFLNSWPKDNKIILCNEKEGSLALSDYLRELPKDMPVNIMIGPEGGFSAQELKTLSSKDFITSVHLGDNILRAETAALAALSMLV